MSVMEGLAENVFKKKIAQILSLLNVTIIFVLDVPIPLIVIDFLALIVLIRFV